MADPRGNEHLTAMTGAVLLVLFLAECWTILNMGKYLTLHVFLGFLLIGPVCLKIGSTLLRFTRYYTGSAPYVAKGPPALPRRLLGPLVILTTVAVLGSGVMLVVTGQPGQDQWLEIHRLSFLAWVVVIVIHVGSYLPRLPRLLTERLRPGRIAGVLSARLTRWILLSGSLAAGLILAVLSYHLAASWGG
jgi:hypothetical protein